MTISPTELALPAETAPQRTGPTNSLLPWLAVALITLAGTILRLIYIGKVQTDPFYDAAVRSMSLSLHNFFFGAFDPTAATAIDKPPIDLWLQVASVKLFGFTSTTLKLPEAIAGILSIPLLFAAVRRMWSTTAALAAAAALALTPVEVITSRSDTMDGVMMALIVLALYLTVRACESGHWAWLLGAAAALGIAFDVKLLESLVALPGLALLAYLGMPGPRTRRLLQSLAAAAVYVAVALAWLTATLFFPTHERPYAIGSTNGSAWNAAFVFNGTERLGPKSPEPDQTVYESGHRYPTATQSDRDHIPIVPPSPTRLLSTIGPLSGERLGLELLIGILLGIPALLTGVLLDRRTLAESESLGVEGPGTVGESEKKDVFVSHAKQTHLFSRSFASAPVDYGPRIRLAVAVGLVVWVATGIVLFSHMIRLHPRYVEGLVPGVAALLGIGVAWAGGLARGEAGESGLSGNPTRLIALAVALVVTVFYVERLEYGITAVWWITLIVACAALGVAWLARTAPSRAGLWSGATVALTLAAVLVLPLRADVTAIEDHVTDAGYVGALPHQQLQAISSYTQAHREEARYLLAAESATEIGALIVKTAQPVVILTTYDARVLTDVAQLKRLIARGEVRYAFLNTFCTTTDLYATNPACSEPVRWIRSHGTDVSIKAGLQSGGLLYLLPGAKPTAGEEALKSLVKRSGRAR
jgi:4-amino-4-deoxy-L-arabinose transferase-like glycosyltransferase